MKSFGCLHGWIFGSFDFWIFKSLDFYVFLDSGIFRLPVLLFDTNATSKNEAKSDQLKRRFRTVFFPRVLKGSACRWKGGTIDIWCRVAVSIAPPMVWSPPQPETLNPQERNKYQLYRGTCFQPKVKSQNVSVKTFCQNFRPKLSAKTFGQNFLDLNPIQLV